MHGIFPGILISASILFFGVLAFVFLIKSYRGKLLVNFSQKVSMTFWLGAIFAGLFLLANGALSYFVIYFKETWKFASAFEASGLFFRLGMSFFILNAVLILACRSLIKALSGRF